MPATFSYSDTWTLDRNYVRFLIGDTVTAYRKFYDEELTQILVQKAANLPYRAAAIACEILSQDPDRLVLTYQGISGAMTIREMQAMYAARAAAWRALAG
jgi:hypothetical protein